jgi:hypothetical protein
LIIHDNIIFQYLNKIPGFTPKGNIILKNSIFIRNKSDVWSPKILGKLFKAMKTVPPTSIEQLSIVNSINKNHFKKLFWGDF